MNTKQKKIPVMILSVLLLSSCSCHDAVKIRPFKNIPGHYNEKNSNYPAYNKSINQSGYDKNHTAGNCSSSENINPGHGFQNKKNIKSGIKKKNPAIPAVKLCNLSEKWWNRFKDKKLNRVMDKVIKYNPDIDLAFYRFREATALFRVSEANKFPEMDLKANASRSKNISGSIIKAYNISAAAEYEIDLWGKIKSSRQSAWFKRSASFEDLKTAYISITASSAEIYFKAVEKQKEKDLDIEIIDEAQNALEITELNYNEGITGADSLYSIKRTLAGAKTELYRAETLYANYVHALSILAGDYPGLKKDTASTLPEPAAINIEFSRGIPSELLKNRPDIRSAVYSLKAADQEIGAAVANRFPSINLLFEAGKSGTNFYGTMERGNIFNLASNLLSPVIDWGKRKAEVKRARAKFNESLAIYKKTILNAFKEVEDALINISSSYAIFKEVAEKKSLTELDMEQVKNKYINGIVPYLSVISKKIELLTIKKQFEEVKLDFILQKISLARALGCSWMDQDIKQKNLVKQQPEKVKSWKRLSDE